MLTLIDSKSRLKCSDGAGIPFLIRNSSSTFSDEERSRTLVISVPQNFILFFNSIHYPLDVRGDRCQARVTW